jgi:Lrp/AsnC family transcriptional regulator, leucine-responsive regulatory protein
MNQSRYLIRQIDKIDRAIIAALTEDGRMTFKDLANRIGMSSPSVTERILKLKDAGAIRGYSVLVDPTAFGLVIAAHIRMRALPGQLKRVEQMLVDTPEIVEADHVTGEDCFQVKAMVSDVQSLETVASRFSPFASTDTAIIQSSPVVRRLPRL